MPTPKLTKKQRLLLKQLKDLMYRVRLDITDLASESNPEMRTVYLEAAKNKIIRSEVIMRYVLMDEFLTDIICHYYFGKKRSFPRLWRTKRFRSFNYFIVEKLYILQKLDLAKTILDIPKWVASDVAALNDLRNGIAHSFFPENRRRKPEWKGQSVFTDEGFDQFLVDMEKLANFFFGHSRNGSPESAADLSPG
jgi:hypothetical protein